MKVSDSHDTWDIYLNQKLAAVRFNVNESTKFSPFYLLYNCDPVLPIDNIMKPRRRYLGKQNTQDRFRTTTQVICNGTSASKEG